ncbi:glycerophosphodiester phosphodiesterase family protein [Rhizobium calliandrae]|uniref:Glycerophosphodiester phosphodiesterase family protein n=1 Tax=Rhizobium calliandrae TaxID=1312182 RepID=A0ABT7KAJ7_9HYPH|nr:glycerophosphodiester phosphodiesterase family protein [Rhizobium calliandrae]MDL2405644.1 glycerophosphodiester phosphodiesterase family protein [Rhizobium calliandrae]
MPLIASHRGGSHLWPENTRLAFSETAKLDVDLVEFDVHQTRDSKLVVHHDALIDRMTDGKGAIADLSYDELMRHIVIGSGGETIPTLAETIDIFGPSAVDLRLEIKTRVDGKPYEGMESRIVDELLATDMLTRTMVTSFALSRLEAFAAALDERGLNVGELLGFIFLCSPQTVAQIGWRGVIAALGKSGIREIALRADLIDAAVLDLLRRDGVTVHGWAAHTSEAAKAMFRFGVASFTTDRPDLAIAAKRG